MAECLRSNQFVGAISGNPEPCIPHASSDLSRALENNRDRSDTTGTHNSPKIMEKMEGGKKIETFCGSDGDESAARRSIREALQKRQAELISSPSLSTGKGRTRDNEIPDGSPDFLNGRTRRVLELLKEAEARFDSKFRSRTNSETPSLDLEDELVA